MRNVRRLLPFVLPTLLFFGALTARGQTLQLTVDFLDAGYIATNFLDAGLVQTQRLSLPTGTCPVDGGSCGANTCAVSSAALPNLNGTSTFLITSIVPNNVTNPYYWYVETGDAGAGSDAGQLCIFGGNYGTDGGFVRWVEISQ